MLRFIKNLIFILFQEKYRKVILNEHQCLQYSIILSNSAPRLIGNRFYSIENQPPNHNYDCHLGTYPFRQHVIFRPLNEGSKSISKEEKIPGSKE
jgi:hypothetical protein